MEEKVNDQFEKEEEIDKMIQNYYDGCDIVYGVRNNRKKDTLFKRRTAERIAGAITSSSAFTSMRKA